MDRDFVLVVKEPAESAVEGLWAPDDEEHVALASFHPVFPDDVPESPRCVKLVVDCSGSMGGDSIAQAKAALREIISSLKPTDFFNLITFGSTFNLLFSEPVIANEDNTEKAARFVEQIDATMGGTEIGAALNAAYSCGKIEGLPADLLLITDGEVWNHEQVVKDAQKSGHQIFTVGVGSAVSEAFVRRIAETNSGACELVSPREDMSERIVRHFRRIDQPKAKSVHIEWPTTPLRQVPGEVETVYAGDTLHVFAWLPELPVGKVRLVITFEDGRTVIQEVILPTDLRDNEELFLDLPRVAASARIPVLDSKQGSELAVRYQLVTEQTSCVLVFEREDEQKSDEVPALRKVPQMLAAGWGGMGSIQCDMAMEEPMLDQDAMSVNYDVGEVFDEDMDYLDIPSFLRRQVTTDFDRLVSSLNSRYPETTTAKLDIASIAELVALGLDRDVADALLDLLKKGVKERDIVVAFLMALSDSDYGKNFSRHAKRWIRMADKGGVSDKVVIDAIKQVVSG